MEWRGFGVEWQGKQRVRLGGGNALVADQTEEQSMEWWREWAGEQDELSRLAGSNLEHRRLTKSKNFTWSETRAGLSRNLPQKVTKQFGDEWEESRGWNTAELDYWWRSGVGGAGAQELEGGAMPRQTDRDRQGKQQDRETHRTIRKAGGEVMTIAYCIIHSGEWPLSYLVVNCCYSYNMWFDSAA